MPLHDVILIAVMVLVSALIQRWSSPPKVSTIDEARLARLERKVDLLLAQTRRLDGDESPASVPMDEVRALVREGRTINAIKLYRELTGEGLKESKDAVEALAITERALKYVR